MRVTVVLIVLAGSLAYSAPPEAVGPKTYLAPQQDKLEQLLRQALPSRNQRMPLLQPHVLGSLKENELKREASRDGLAQVGVHRKLGSEAMLRAQVEGAIWRLAVQSPGARGMRLHFTRFAIGSGQVWIHDGSGEEGVILGPYTGSGPNGDGEFWSETVFSENVAIEYQRAEGQPTDSAVPFVIEEISHLFAPTSAASKTGERAAAASCELDVTCYPDWAWTAKGVARLAFEKEGGTYFCSGTLLNTRHSSFVPYLITANHCISSEAMARTLEATWFFQKDSCNGTLPNRSFPRSLGATLLATGDLAKGDFALLKLRSVPDGVTFQGWDPNEKSLGTPVTVVHHRTGDYKRISFGNLAVNSSAPSTWYWVQYSAGITEPGSSGAGLFSAPGVFMGSLSTGAISDTAEGRCRISPYSGGFGRFSAYYPALRGFLEDTASTPSSSSKGVTLSSGVARNFALPAVNGPTLFSGESGFRIDVPQGATRLEVKLTSATPGVDLDLYVRFGQDPVLSNDSVTSDYASLGPAADEAVVVTGSSNPALKAGAYYIAIGSFTRGVRIDATITATVSTNATPPPPPTSVLTSGLARTFTLSPVTGPTMYSGTSGYTIVVPQGATSLDIVVRTATPRADVDLFARYNEDISIANGEIRADFASQSEGGEERITINASSTPPLRAGTYYIALALFTPNVAVTGTITATVSNGTVPAPTGANVLTSGRARTLFYNPVTSPTLYNGEQGYVIDVPENATRLEVQLSTQTTGADLDLFVSYGKDNLFGAERVVADYGSAGPDGSERIVITADSTPPLRPGRYYISVGVFTTGTNILGSLTATVSTGGSLPSTPSTPTVLTLGQPARFSLPAVSGPTLFNGNQSFQVRIPTGSVYMRVQLVSDNPAVDVDLFGRYEADVTVDNEGKIVADYGADGPTGNERLSVSRVSSPALRPGLFYLSLVAFSKDQPATGTIVVTATDDVLSIPNVSGEALLSGRSVTYTLPAVSAPTLFAGSSAYRISVDGRHTALRVGVKDNAPGSKVAVYVRRGQQPAVVNGRMIADASSEAGSEGDIVLEGASLQPGVYYIALGLDSVDRAAAGVLTATLTAADGVTTDVDLTLQEGGWQTLQPKPSSEIRYALPNKYREPEEQRELVKHTDVLKKRQRMNLVSR